MSAKLRRALAPYILFHFLAFHAVQIAGGFLYGWVIWPRTLDQAMVDVASLIFGIPAIVLFSIYVALYRVSGSDCADQRGSVVMGNQAGGDIIMSGRKES